MPSDEELYKLIMVLIGLEPLKINIIITLSHIAPKKVSGTELTKLLGYSKKARTIYRGVLDELDQMNMITLEREKNQYLIGANRDNPLMGTLTDLALAHGKDYSENLMEDL